MFDTYEPLKTDAEATSETLDTHSIYTRLIARVGFIILQPAKTFEFCPRVLQLINFVAISKSLRYSF
jgi:hypothetical protein